MQLLLRGEDQANMKLEGLHHITMITGDAQRNVAFYADVLGLRLVKKTVNFDDPEASHLYFGAETGEPGEPGAGTVHHIAGASRDEDHLRWQERVRDAGGFVTDVRDRDYFDAIYFREPRGILFEIATLSPGFAVDEDPERLGEELRVPRMHARREREREEANV
jgi:catechol 2,3-dioxygenase-like lactoylglutathione lyase family enzyme